ncbi:GNAT family N-acetyltransferase [Symbiobacterium terraclitae]|uniref:GNAT family N-acetyltransferase n=1 Tax=Symbiobacterium terraclitae TaxID=557451 RepID=UPI0035B545DA
MAATLHHPAVRFVSRTGRTVTIRPCTPADAPLIADMYRCLTAETLYLRYCSSGLSVSGEREAARLCGGDPDDQAVLLALSRGEVVGVAELGRVDEETAEIAFLVRDDCQREGIGTKLAEQLVEVAREMGFTRLQAYMLAENYAIRRLAAKIPYPRTWESRWGEMCVTFDLSPALALR